jgi:hypothetical protein
LSTAIVSTAPEIFDVQVNFNPANNSMELSPSQEAASCAAAQELNKFQTFMEPKGSVSRS